MIHSDKNVNLKNELVLGIDIGSTTVKCVVIDPDSLEIMWQKYQRHETRQGEKLLEILQEIKQQYPQIDSSSTLAFITGSGAGPLKSSLGCRFVQEVNAVTIAVEKLHPDVNSVIELGGQDAKVIIFQQSTNSEERRIITSMNDKCASGTGATIDKCVTKVGMSHEQLASLQFRADKIHHVAAKCGVFAETDIVNLIKSGVPSDEIMNSLADAIVMQNLSVLTRGNTIQPKVLLLGGPNTYLPFLQQCWQYRVPQLWDERKVDYQKDSIPQLVFTPDKAEYYAAFGAAVFGLQEKDKAVEFNGIAAFEHFLQNGRKSDLAALAGKPLIKDQQELDLFLQQYQLPEFTPVDYPAGSIIKAYIGVDGGSTSSKSVLINEKGKILFKAYQLSKGNPIQDCKELLQKLFEYAEQQQCSLDILGFGATGYAADILDKSLHCDANIVETVAHMMSAKDSCGDNIDVVCDIGGQDIKVLFLQNNNIKDFKLSNQCSAGNGMLLQAMADQFGVAVQDYASVAFKAEYAPQFSYGCAVFLDSDRVNFQKEGFQREELFSGLAQVLPKNVWQYVVQIPRLAELGTRYVLQGGTQYNLAAVKAQIDYIRKRVPNADIQIHPHCGEAGAIGAALEAKRVVELHGDSRFIGLTAAINITYTTRTDESTRCGFCDNLCSRTFIDTKTPAGTTARYIAGFSCEKGTVESKQAVVELNKERRRLKGVYPNLVDYEAHLAFKQFNKADPLPEASTLINRQEIKRTLFGYGPVKRKTIKTNFKRSDNKTKELRETWRVGIPQSLNIYTVAPFMRTYLETLGLKKQNIIFSGFTSEELWLAGGKHGSVDPCYPAKIALAHVHHLLKHKKFKRKKLDTIWFPCITHMPTFVSNTVANTSCPIVSGTPKVVTAALTKEHDLFADSGVEFIDQPLDFDNPALLKHQMFNTWKSALKVTEDESNWACEQALQSMRVCDKEMQHRGLNILQELEAENKVGLLMLGRPYHNDPGLNHEILEEFQSLGYPILSMRSIPKDEQYLQAYFSDDIKNGLISDVYDIRDVWPENYSVNSAEKVWAAKFAARHPNLAVIDLSSFKCGHDAPTYGIIDKIFSCSNTPNLTLHDIDANKPTGSIKIRVKTYAYALQRYQEKLDAQSADIYILQQQENIPPSPHQTKLSEATQTDSLDSEFSAFLKKEKTIGSTIEYEDSNSKTEVNVQFQAKLNIRDDNAREQLSHIQEKARMYATEEESNTV
ncbi:Activator of (R)-2-hydroxyglutaryl-CoA dehydratase [hydrothermal vent metagenome]|uniref:Activator of (R)-2-hydroxyglutaryl-CoA dehydratase n=1 Tax=hydrothermal vent metagenome TaxID=652676 RepID=A0A3B0XUJ9_9ZZZZ